MKAIKTIVGCAAVFAWGWAAVELCSRLEWSGETACVVFLAPLFLLAYVAKKAAEAEAKTHAVEWEAKRAEHERTKRADQ